MMSKPRVDPTFGISSVDVLILTERHPACRWREAQPGSCKERENLAGDAKGKGPSGAKDLDAARVTYEEKTVQGLQGEKIPWFQLHISCANNARCVAFPEHVEEYSIFPTGKSSGMGLGLCSREAAENAKLSLEELIRQNVSRR
jgi:hypothetical protein